MNKKDQLKDLFELIKIKSISMDKECLPEMKKAREFIIGMFKKMGFETKVLKGIKHDAVFAQKIVDPKAPTFLIYGHYDVQPADPIAEWKTKPFNPTVKGKYLYARGATDNKGQFMVQVNAVSSIKGVNFKFIVEGEEEIGSISIESIAKKYGKDLLKSDYIIVSDSEMISPTEPTIDISLRGLTYTEIFLEAAKHDMHSGQFGGVVKNPANALSEIISKLKDENDRVLIPGFYDDIVKPTKEELKDFNSIKITKETLAKEGSFYKVPENSKYTLNERRWTQPTLDVNGITSGYQDEGVKTIIPARASAKVSMRLVPGQDPVKIYKLFEKYVKRITPKELKIRVEMHAGAQSYKAPTTDPIFKVMKKSLKKFFKKEAVFNGVGGTIGFVPIMASALKIPVIMVGWGLPDDDLHAPNEHFLLDNYFKGISVMKDFYSNFSRLKTTKKV